MTNRAEQYKSKVQVVKTVNEYKSVHEISWRLWTAYAWQT